MRHSCSKSLTIVLEQRTVLHKKHKFWQRIAVSQPLPRLVRLLSLSILVWRAICSTGQRGFQCKIAILSEAATAVAAGSSAKSGLLRKFVIDDRAWKGVALTQGRRKHLCRFRYDVIGFSADGDNAQRFRIDFANQGPLESGQRMARITDASDQIAGTQSTSGYSSSN